MTDILYDGLTPSEVAPQASELCRSPSVSLSNRLQPLWLTPEVPGHYGSMVHNDSGLSQKPIQWTIILKAKAKQEKAARKMLLFFLIKKTILQICFLWWAGSAGGRTQGLKPRLASNCNSPDFCLPIS
jgi:hypothetical protein